MPAPPTATGLSTGTAVDDIYLSATRRHFIITLTHIGRKRNKARPSMTFAASRDIHYGHMLPTRLVLRWPPHDNFLRGVAHDYRK